MDRPSNVRRLLSLDPMSRGAYAAWGFGLAALKFNLDRVIGTLFGHSPLFPWFYYMPEGRPGLREIAPDERAFYLALAFAAIPFAALGLFFTARRLRSSGWPLWLVVLFFLPGINLIFFAILCAVPPAGHPRAAEYAGLRGWLCWILPRGWLPTAAVSVSVTSTVTILLVWMSVGAVGSYGAALFFAVPFVGGFLAVLLASVRGPIPYDSCMAVSLGTVMVSGGLLLAFAVEGFLCLVMAAPVAFAMAWIGGTFGFFVQMPMWRHGQGGAAMCVSIAVLPAAFLGDAQQQPPLRACVTEVRIAAPPEVVWDHVIEFSRIPPPRELVFNSGIAYPVEAVIEGRGVGAIRHCRFSTGDFVEPITHWEAPHRLAFSVSSQPPPMHELSPYDIHPPHLDGYLVSERGEFLLERVPHEGALLRGTTWYRQKLWPQFYWSRFSDYLIHAIHRRVLHHIREESEKSLLLNTIGDPKET